MRQLSDRFEPFRGWQLFFMLLLLSVSMSVFAGRTINSATLNGGSSVTVSPGESITARLNVTTSGNGSNNDWESTDWLISTSSSGSYTCNNHSDNTTSGTHTESFTITAPSTPGTYNAYFEASHNDSCGGSGSNLFTLTNAIVVSSGGGGSCSSETVADNFDSVSFSQNDGSQNWSASWQETGESDGASSGLVRVRSDLCTSGNCLRLGVISGASAQTYSNVGASRQADLSGASSATLTFNYRTGVQQNSQIVTLQASSNGGSSWTTLRTYNISSTNFSATAESVDLTSYISSNTQIRFLASGTNAVVGFYADDIEISYDDCTSLLAEWRMDENSWAGVSDEVVDNSGNGYHAVAVNGATTLDTNPAISGNPGTCRYGDFDDAGSSTGNYLEIPSFPNQTADFTITGWIRSSDVSRSGQRIFADDQSNTGGYALSLGDPGSGRLRFYARGTSPISLDTGSVISNDTWYFVAAVADITNSQKTIYVYSSSGNLLNTTTGSFSGSWGTDSGPASIGGETNSGETANRFYGNLDEIRFYEGALSTSELEAIVADTHTCAGTPAAEWRLDEISWDGTADEIIDSSGNDYHGLSGFSTSTVSGKVCQAVDLSTNGTSDYLILDHNALDGLSDFSFSAWLKTSQAPSQQEVIQALGSSANDDEFEVALEGNNSIFVKIQDVSQSFSLSSNELTSGDWEHIAITRSGSQACLYINGSLKSCQSGYPTGSMSIQSGTLLMGQEQDSFGGSFSSAQDWEGLLDEPMIFNGALTASEVSSVYSNQNSGLNWDGSSRTCPTTSSCTDTFRDDFSVAAFSNNDGDKNWAGNWVEVDGQGLGASTGNVFISGGELYLDDQPNTGGTPGVTREVDLSGYDTATLSLSYRTTSGVDSSDQVSLEISSNGGSSWTTLQNYTGISGTTSGTSSFTITSYMASNTQIRLRVTNLYGGGSESFVVDYIEIEAEDQDCTSTVDHYAISHSGLGVTCEAETVTITAHDSSDAAVEPGNSVTMTINTGTGVGDWILSSGGGSLANGTANDGIAAYTWGAGESVVTLKLQHLATTTSPHMDIDIVDGNSATDKDGDAAEDEKLEFRDAGFRFYGGGVASNIGNQIAGKESNIAPGNQTIEIRAVQTNTDTGACEARLLNTQTVQMAYQCQNPTTCQGDNKLTIDNSTTLRANPASGVSLYGNISLNFGSNGQASFTLDYADAGQIRLHATKTIAASGDDPEVTLSGSSNNFVVRPFGFYVDVPGNPGATSASGNGFKAAGETFSTTVTAVPWQSADDSDNDGAPDSGADLSDNGFVANFGQEISAETVTISRALVAPSGGANPVLTDSSFSGFSNGAKTNTGLSWSEVGIISFAAALTDNDYLGAGAVTGSVPYVGRFYPYHFSLASDPIINRSDIGSCSSSFTYMGETFNSQFRLTAKNTSNATTTNYAGSFAKLDTATKLNLGAVNSGNNLISRLNIIAATLTWPSLGSASAGIGTMDVDLSIDRDASGSVDGPFDSLQVGTAAHDGDAGLASFDLDVDNNGSDERALLGSTFIRYGRLYVKNAFGPETEDLAIPLQIQYYNGSEFVVNGDDSCTTYIDTGASLDHSSYGSDNLASGETGVTAPSSATAVTAGNSPIATPLLLSAPGLGNEGQVDVEYDAPAWLEFDWLGAGVTDPIGQATFGRYRGHDRVIYWRENFSQ